jgi:metal-responsive CopG/Arc/MetJ family transcriptional regulator
MVRRRGKPKTTGTGRMRIATWLPPALVRRLDDHAGKTGRNRSDLIEAGALLVLGEQSPSK